MRGAFLDADGHPAVTFASTAVRHLGGTRFEVTGNLMIRGVSKPISLVVALTRTTADAVGFTGSVTINRHHWGVNWNFATKLMVSPKVTLKFVAAVRRPLAT